MNNTGPDPWPALDELASMLNDLAGQVLAHTKQFQQLTPAQHHSNAGNADAHAEALRAWVEALVDEYGLHAQIGPPDRWENIPPLRAELLGLKIADVRRLKLEQGSFELVYWHDALNRVVDRAGQHADRWHQDQQNQLLLQMAGR
ncbi:MAG TPA: hypothetical protein VFP34_18570 [Microlunatus sp.]|nr:hypothetical protein [Microlunatus sp.]